MSRLKINDFSIDWVSKDSHYFFDAGHPEAMRFQALANKMPFYPGHIYLFTSGFQKVALLSKKAFLISADSVNRYLDCQSKRRWLVPLPLFHVAGLSVLARSFCGGYSFIKGDTKWKPEAFVQTLISEKISYTSLVPTQVYDLVERKLSCPASLEFALVGGGQLKDSIYERARKLGWPLLPTYGMTEVCSQIATADRASLKKKAFPHLKNLSHIELRKTKGILEIKSPSLLTGYFYVDSNKFDDPKTFEGWFSTQDRGELKEGLVLKGRSDEWIKMSGHLVSLEKLSERLGQIVKGISHGKEFHLIALPDERKEHQVVLVTDSYAFDEVLNILNQFNKGLPSHKKATSIYMIEEIPRTALLKVNRAEIKRQLHLTSSAA